MRTRAITITALVCAALVIVIGGCIAARAETAPGRARTGANESAAVAAAAAFDGSTSPPVREPAEPEGATRESESDPPSPFDLRGSFVVVDHDGVEHAAESGGVEVEIDGCSTGFEVTSGTWRKPDFTSRDRMRVVEAVLGGKPVVCDIDITLDPKNPPLHLRGRWLAPVRLRVVGSDSKADLANVQVVKSDFEQSYGRWLHPGDSYATAPAVVAATPILLWPEPGEARDYLIGAPGYAWARIEVDPNESAERWVRLDRGGDVDIAIAGTWPYGATLRLSREDGGRPLAEWAPEAGVMRLVAVPGGSWHVAVAKGWWFQQPLVLGRGSVEVTPGTVATVAITLRSDLVPPPYASLAGTLVYPNTWRRPPRIDIEPAGDTKPWGDTSWLDPERIANGSDEYRWSAGRKSSGAYQVQVTGSGFLTRFYLAPTGNTDLRIVVPEPCDIQLRVLDAATGKVFAIQDEHGWPPVWEMDFPEWDDSPTLEHLTLQPDGSYAAQVPPGAIWIFVHADGYEASRTRHEVVRGTNHFVVTVARECGVEITLRDGDATVPWPDQLIAALTDTSGRPMNRYRSYSFHRVAAKAPGELTLTIPDVTGFEPIPTRKVIVTPATWTPVAIPLQRKQ